MKESFKEWKRDILVEANLKYKKATKSAKQAVTIARKEKSGKLMKEMKVDVSSKKMFMTAKQSMKDRKDVTGNGCIQHRFGKLCIKEREGAQSGKINGESDE